VLHLHVLLYFAFFDLCLSLTWSSQGSSVLLGSIDHEDTTAEVGERGMALVRSIKLLLTPLPFLASGLVEIYDQEFCSILDI
jgi:hypothetical protein